MDEIETEGVHGHDDEGNPAPQAPGAYGERLEGVRGARVRTRDVPVFRFGASGLGCRLQVFEGPGLDPVFVAVQSIAEGGALMNRAESLVTAVWQAFTPLSDTPPAVVALMLNEDGTPVRAAKERPMFLIGCKVDAEDVGPERVDRRPGLRAVAWPALSPRELSDLIDCEVDTTRGPGFTPVEEVPEPCCGVSGDEARMVFVHVDTLHLPRTRPFRTHGCMDEFGPGFLGRVARRARPSAGGRDCCWYHGGDWRVVCSAAHAVYERARANGCAHFAAVAAVADRCAEAEAMDEWQREAFDSLFHDPMMFEPDLWINGQHRGQAILDAGVSRILVGAITPERALN